MTASNPAQPPFPPSGAPPAVPEGWRAEWSNEHKTWYYLNPTTQASTWQNPLNNAPPPLSPPPYASGSNNPESNRDLYGSDDEKSSSTARGFPPLLGRVFGSHSHSPVPPPVNAHTRPTGAMANRLYIHAASFSDANITQKVRALVTPEQTLSIRCDSLTFHFGDPWPNHRKQFSMLYSYGHQPWQLVAAIEGPETIVLHPAHPIDPTRAAFVQPPTSRVIAVVWGNKNALFNSDSSSSRSVGMKMMEVEREGRLEASNAWMGFDGASNMEKMSIVYYRHAEGSVGIASAREGETLRLPWNSFAGAM